MEQRYNERLEAMLKEREARIEEREKRHEEMRNRARERHDYLVENKDNILSEAIDEQDEMASRHEEMRKQAEERRARLAAHREAMSGLTTTGSTVFTGLETLPEGLLLWRSMLQWFGGIGIIVVAMVFLPELRVGGMQIYPAKEYQNPRAKYLEK